jgi:hypothetical protein
MRAEKARPLGDVFWGGAIELYRSNADLFAAIDLAEADAFDVRDPERKWHPWTRNVLHLAVNTRRVTGPLPRSFRDLADPKWAGRGRIGMSNPATSGTAYTIVPALVTVHGWDFVEALLANVRLTDASETSFKWLKDGEVAAGFIFEKMLLDYVGAGAPPGGGGGGGGRHPAGRRLRPRGRGAAPGDGGCIPELDVERGGARDRARASGPPLGAPRDRAFPRPHGPDGGEAHRAGRGVDHDRARRDPGPLRASPRRGALTA